MIEFFVAGIPQQKGSKTPGFNKKTGKGFIRDTNKNAADWQNLVKLKAQDCVQAPLWEGPVAMTLTFYLPRPKSVSVKRRPYPITKPDLNKMTRTIEDALTGVIYRDDSQICSRTEYKRYADAQAPGVRIDVSEYRGGHEHGNHHTGSD